MEILFNRPRLQFATHSSLCCEICVVFLTLTQALKASGCSHANVAHKPRLLSDNGSSYISRDLAGWLNDKGIGDDAGAVRQIG